MAQAKVNTVYEKETESKRIGDVTQIAEHLLSKCEACLQLSPMPKKNQCSLREKLMTHFKSNLSK
jgi:hypothetical protein